MSTEYFEQLKRLLTQYYCKCDEVFYCRVKKLYKKGIYNYATKLGIIQGLSFDKFEFYLYEKKILDFLSKGQKEHPLPKKATSDNSLQQTQDERRKDFNTTLRFWKNMAKKGKEQQRQYKDSKVASRPSGG